MTHSHNHRHAHEHGAAGAHADHNHAPASFGRAFLIGVLLNIAFVAIEAVYGVAAHSTALLADAGHNLSDVMSLLVAWGAQGLTRRAASVRFTYGLRKSSVLAALFNAVLLLVAVGAIALEAVRHIFLPEPVAAGTVMVVAAIGIGVNGMTALLFASGRKGDINIRGAFLHMAADAGVSAGVVAAGFLIAQTGWQWIDPAVSLAIVAVILVGTWGLLRDSVSMSLDAVPANIDPQEVETSLRSLKGVSRVHDLHIWPMSTTEVALTCHLIMPGGFPGDSFVHGVATMLQDRFHIGHTTVQIEVEDADPCVRERASQDGCSS